MNEENMVSMMSTDNHEGQQKAANKENEIMDSRTHMVKHHLEFSRDNGLISKHLDEVDASPKVPPIGKPKSSNAPQARSPLMATNTNSNIGYERFAMSHDKEFGRMPSITETHESRMQRHAKYNSKLPAVYKRLTSPQPKRTPIPNKGFMWQQEKDKEKHSSVFGRSLPIDVTQYDDVTMPTSEKHPLTPRTDLKSQTKSKTSANLTPSSSKTTSIWNSRINKLALPKGRKIDFGLAADEETYSSMASGTTNSFTPYRRPFKYEDTTKISDREFTAYKEQIAEKLQISTPNDKSKTRGINNNNL